MHAYLITGGTPLGRSEKIETLITALHGSKFDLRILTPPPDAPSISVEMIREWIRTLTFKGSKNNALVGIIRDAHLMTPQAQTALLKTLEEPPGPVKILIETDSIGTLLPTICSRMIHIFLGTDGEKAKEVCPVTIGESIQKAQGYGKTKAQAGVYLSSVIESIHTSWIQHPEQISTERLKHCIEAIRMLSVNVSPFSAIEQALFPK